jgi:hypothetical protein
LSGTADCALDSADAGAPLIKHKTIRDDKTGKVSAAAEDAAEEAVLAELCADLEAVFPDTRITKAVAE